MKVHDSNLNSVTIGTHASGRADGVRGGGRAGAVGANDSSGQDQISISDLGSLLRSVSGTAPTRVTQLAELYKSGNYHPDVAAVSKGIVNDVLGAG